MAAPTRVLPKKLGQRLFGARACVFRTFAHDPPERSNANGPVPRNSDMMLATFHRRQLHVTAGLPLDLVSEAGQRSS
jgi:hypothetical protein